MKKPSAELTEFTTWQPLWAYSGFWKRRFKYSRPIIAACERLLRAAAHCGWRLQVSIASSSEVYGSQGRIALHEDLPLVITPWGTAALELCNPGRWMDYNQQSNHGYRDPDNYRRYALTLLGQWKINDDDNVVIRLSPGEYKDASMGGFKYGTDATLEGTFGLYRGFYAHAALNYSSNSLLTGNYDAWSIMFDLSYRF